MPLEFPLKLVSCLRVSLASMFSLILFCGVDEAAGDKLANETGFGEGCGDALYKGR